MDTFPLWEHVVIYLRLDIFNVDVMHAFMSGRQMFNTNTEVRGTSKYDRFVEHNMLMKIII